MGDVDEAVTLVAQTGKAAEQPLRLLRRQNLGRLVKDQHARPGEQLLQNLDLLLVAHGEPAHREPEIHLEAQAFGEPAHAAAHLARTDRPRRVI